MNKQSSTQIPKSPELQPIPSAAAKFWNVVSLLLTFSGIGLMGFGGWMYIRLQIEANQPLPARIVEVVVDPNPVSTATPTPPPDPTATPVKPTAVVTDLKANAANSLSDTLSIEDVGGDGNSAAIEEVVYVAEATAAERIEPETVATEEPAPPTATATANLRPSPEPTVETDPALSLADNPLVVVDKAEAESSPIEPAPANEPVSETITSPPSDKVFVSRIVADSIELDAEVVEVGWQPVVQNGVESNVWVVADYAAGWHKNSALPGEGGNIVLSAHHNIKGEVFRHTIDLEPGAVVTLYDQENRAYDYVIQDKFIVKDKGEPESVRRANAKWIGPFEEERLTLVTCWPYNNNTHRAIVIGKPVSE